LPNISGKVSVPLSGVVWKAGSTRNVGGWG
jgi:hypothetical protein